MPFRDSYRTDDNSVSSGYVQQEFHPVRDLIGSVIDTVRSNRERRIQARHERELARHGISISDNSEYSNNRNRPANVDRPASVDRDRRPSNYIPDIDGDPKAASQNNRNQDRQNLPRTKEQAQVPHEAPAPQPTPAVRPETIPQQMPSTIEIQKQELPAPAPSILETPQPDVPRQMPSPADLQKRELPPPVPQENSTHEFSVLKRTVTPTAAPPREEANSERGTRGIPAGHMVSTRAGDEPPQAVQDQTQEQHQQHDVKDFPDYKEFVTPKPVERVFPDTITVKERNGQSFEIPLQQNMSSDQRLNAYLNARGAELSELDVNATAISDAGLGFLRSAPNLSKLNLNDCDFDNSSMKVLGSQGLKNLRELNLHSTRVGDEGVEHIKALPISTLNLSDTIITDDCMRHLKDMKALQVVNFDYSGIGNEGVKAFKDMRNLRSVSLKGTSITDDAVSELAKAKQLLVLNLEDTKLSPEKVAWLQKSMPTTVITAPDGAGAAQGHKRYEQPHYDRQQENHRPRILKSPFARRG